MFGKKPDEAPKFVWAKVLGEGSGPGNYRCKVKDAEYNRVVSTVGMFAENEWALGAWKDPKAKRNLILVARKGDYSLPITSPYLPTIRIFPGWGRKNSNVYKDRTIPLGQGLLPELLTPDAIKTVEIEHLRASQYDLFYYTRISPEASITMRRMVNGDPGDEQSVTTSLTGAVQDINVMLHGDVLTSYTFDAPAFGSGTCKMVKITWNDLGGTVRWTSSWDSNEHGMPFYGVYFVGSRMFSINQKTVSARVYLYFLELDPASGEVISGKQGPDINPILTKIEELTEKGFGSGNPNPQLPKWQVGKIALDSRSYHEDPTRRANIQGGALVSGGVAQIVTGAIIPIAGGTGGENALQGWDILANESTWELDGNKPALTATTGPGDICTLETYSALGYHAATNSLVIAFSALGYAFVPPYVLINWEAPAFTLVFYMLDSERQAYIDFSQDYDVFRTNEEIMEHMEGPEDRPIFSFDPDGGDPGEAAFEALDEWIIPVREQFQGFTEGEETDPGRLLCEGDYGLLTIDADVGEEIGRWSNKTDGDGLFVNGSAPGHIDLEVTKAPYGHVAGIASQETGTAYLSRTLGTNEGWTLNGDIDPAAPPGHVIAESVYCYKMTGRIQMPNDASQCGPDGYAFSFIDGTGVRRFPFADEFGPGAPEEDIHYYTYSIWGAYTGLRPDQIPIYEIFGVYPIGGTPPDDVTHEWLIEWERADIITDSAYRPALDIPIKVAPLPRFGIENVIQNGRITLGPGRRNLPAPGTG